VVGAGALGWAAPSAARLDRLEKDNV
jgi:hypothetical protein